MPNNNAAVLSGPKVQAATGDYDMRRDRGYAANATWTNTTPAAMAFTVDEDLLLVSASHGMQLGLKVRVASADTLPTGLAAATDYFVIPIDADTFALASSLSNANAGTAIAIADEGVGVHTLTATTLSGTVKLQSSINGTTFTDIGSSSQAFTASGTKDWSADAYLFPHLRMSLALTAGQIDIIGIVFSK